MINHYSCNDLALSLDQLVSFVYFRSVVDQKHTVARPYPELLLGHGEPICKGRNKGRYWKSDAQAPNPETEADIMKVAEVEIACNFI